MYDKEPWQEGFRKYDEYDEYKGKPTFKKELIHHEELEKGIAF